MDLIIGGAYQGKCTFAAEKYGLAAADICDLAVSAPVPARCYVHLEALTRQEAPETVLPLLLAAEANAKRAAAQRILSLLGEDVPKKPKEKGEGKGGNS